MKKSIERKVRGLYKKEGINTIGICIQFKETPEKRVFYREKEIFEARDPKINK